MSHPVQSPRPEPSPWVYRLAGGEEADTIAAVVADCSDGLIDSLLGRLLPGLSACDLLSMVFGQGQGVYRCENVVLCENDGVPAGLLFAYPARDHALPGIAASYLPKRRLRRAGDMIGAAAAETLYINTLWCDPRFRADGLADTLLDFAADWAERLGLAGVCKCVWADHAEELALLERHGFARRRALAVPPGTIKGRAGPHDHGAILMVMEKPPYSQPVD